LIEQQKQGFDFLFYFFCIFLQIDVHVGFLCIMYFFHVGISISNIDYDLGTYSCVKIFFEIDNLEMYLKACVVLVKEL
jgi:hypothetical protein